MKNKKKVLLNLQEHGIRMLKSIGMSVLARIYYIIYMHLYCSISSY
jgi:hypothetical protein